MGLSDRNQFALYADHERGWYPVWQNLDMEGFFPGSGIVFVTVTVRLLYFFLYHFLSASQRANDQYLVGRFLETYRVNERRTCESRSSRSPSFDVPQHDDPRARRVLLSSLVERSALPG